MKNPVLLDNTVLTNFSWARCANLPLELWPGHVCTTQAVIEEYRSGVKKAGLPADIWNQLPILRLTNAEQNWMEGYLPSCLGLGERATLTVAFHRQGVFASDDLQARKIAQALNLPVVGSIGILIKCGPPNNLLTCAQAQDLLKQMINAGYYAPVTNLSTFFDR